MVKSNPRLGFHYYPDDSHFSRSDLETWLPILKSMDAGWLTLRATPTTTIPEFFIRGLIEAAIEPVIHMPCTLGEMSPSEIPTLLRDYAQWGVRYVVVFDRPNLKTSWKSVAWARQGLVERYLDCVLPILNATHQAGLRPVLPPLEPGGDYWDTAFLEAALLGLARRGQQGLLRELCMGLYLWTYGKPLDWGEGGPVRWPDARPYSTPPGSQDHRGLHIYEWYAAVSTKVLGFTLPMLVLAGGRLPTSNHQEVDEPDQHAEHNLAIARMLEDNEIPSTVLNMAFYLLTCEPQHPDAPAAWFPTLQHPLPLVASLQKHAAAPHKQPVTTINKPLDHYLLLPEPYGAALQHHWSALGDYIMAARPVVGFSLQEARHARKVTLAGNEKALPQAIEDELRSAGCVVRRMPFVPAGPEAPSQPCPGGASEALPSLSPNGAYHA